MNLKKFLAGAVILLSLGVSAFAAKNNTGSKVKVVATIFPEYDWTRQIIGDKADNVELTLLLNNGVDLHSYQPSIKDIAKISECDIFIYVGGESDEWVHDILESVKNPKMKAINLLEVLGDKVKHEEVVEGMEHEHHHDEDHHHAEGNHHEGDHHHEDEHDHDEDEEELDEHVWLSLRNAKILCQEITNALCAKDSANASKYRTNLSAYTAKLDSLDSRFTAAVKNGSKKVVLFGDRFPFRYLVDDYDLSYYAAFTGCSAETEASFKTIAFLSEKVNEYNLNCVCQIESGNGKIAKSIISNSKNMKAKVVTFDSMQSTTSKQIKSGATYLGAMEKNLEALKEALK